jgi:hypothetical protein
VVFFNSLSKDDMLLVKPIDLRHPYIFYLGHLPAFMYLTFYIRDIQLCRCTGEPLTEPKYFTEIFERGIGNYISYFETPIWMILLLYTLTRRFLIFGHLLKKFPNIRTWFVKDYGIYMLRANFLKDFLGFF